MILKKLALESFRNLGRREIELSGGLNLVVGQNTSGKTNLLEAVAVLARGRSFRGGKDQEMVAYSKQMAKIRGEVAEGEKLEVFLSQGEVAGVRTPKKRYLVNGVARRAVDFVGTLKAVVFRPEDLEMVTGSPSRRRDYWDALLEQTDREYYRASLSYRKGLRQRNRLLEQIREGKTTRAALFFWDRLLVENGGLLGRKRREWLDFVNSRPDYFGDLEVVYRQSPISPERLAEYAGREVAAGVTLIGPHRDDFSLLAKEGEKRRDLAVFGSRGEQRLAIFSLKLAELEFMHQKTGQRPVLLLDDIFSELDQENREKLLAVIPKQQTLMTVTETDQVEKSLWQGWQKIELAGKA